MSATQAGVSLHIADADSIQTDVHGQIWLTLVGRGAICIDHTSDAHALRKLGEHCIARAVALDAGATR